MTLCQGRLAQMGERPTCQENFANLATLKEKLKLKIKKFVPIAKWPSIIIIQIESFMHQDV